MMMSVLPVNSSAPATMTRISPTVKVRPKTSRTSPNGRPSVAVVVPSGALTVMTPVRCRGCEDTPQRDECTSKNRQQEQGREVEPRLLEANRLRPECHLRRYQRNRL